MIRDKKQLALALSRLKTFSKPNVRLEQYQTGSDLAAEILWHIHHSGYIKDKLVADLGCGNGIFGIGSLLLGAKKAFFIDIDEEAIKLAKENKTIIEKLFKKKFNTVFYNKNVKEFNNKVDIVIQNPPFGVKKSHTDKIFLAKAMDITKTIYSIHKIESENFISKFAGDSGFKASIVLRQRFPLKRSFYFHKKKIYFVDTGLWKIVILQ